jgi:hypothetical protein
MQEGASPSLMVDQYTQANGSAVRCVEGFRCCSAHSSRIPGGDMGFSNTGNDEWMMNRLRFSHHS